MENEGTTENHEEQNPYLATDMYREKEQRNI